MPRVDGLQATRAIRDLEREHQARRHPECAHASKSRTAHAPAPAHSVRTAHALAATSTHALGVNGSHNVCHRHARMRTTHPTEAPSPSSHLLITERLCAPPCNVRARPCQPHTHVPDAERLRIIGFSANGDDEAICATAADAGVDAMLCKPMKMSSLLACLRRTQYEPRRAE
eukprot:6182708-Pleurochrysis_carterae.AAC.1